MSDIYALDQIKANAHSNFIAGRTGSKAQRERVQEAVKQDKALKVKGPFLDPSYTGK